MTVPARLFSISNRYRRRGKCLTVKLLAKIFIKNSENVTDNKVRSAYGYLCGIVGIAFNIILFAGKFIAGSLSGSVAVTADAFNNLSDAGSSVISLIGFRLASIKPDPHHPFGHGRFEYLASLAISVIICVMGFELGRDSVLKIISPEPVEYTVLTFAILAVSILVKLYMFIYNRSIGKLIDSSTMKATAMDSVSDVASTAAVLVSGLIACFTNFSIDGIMGLVVAGFILFTGISSIRETVNLLLGTAPEPEFVKSIEEIVMSHEGIIGIHDMIVHNYGPGRVFASLHAEVPSDCDIVEIHDTIDNIEHDILREMNCLATIHMDPIDIRDEETVLMREEVREIIAKVDPVITFHDFRMVSGPTHTNVIFDIVVPHNFKYSDDEIAGIIAKAIHEKNEKYFAVIDVDKDFAAYQCEKTEEI